MNRYQYKALPANLVVQILAAQTCAEAGYITDDWPARTLHALLRDGFRWVRTDNEYSIFEKVQDEN